MTDGREPEAAILKFPGRGACADAPARPPETLPGAESSDTSFEVVLDDEVAPTAPTPVDVAPTVEPIQQPILPDHLRSWALVKGYARRAGGRAAYRAGFHSVRAPKYLALSIWWGFVGLLRLITKQISWWWVAEATSLRRTAVDKNDGAEWQKLHKETKQARYTRGRWLLLELLGLAVVVFALLKLTPVWVLLIGLAVVIPLLARYGRPVDKPIVSAAVVTPRFRTISADIVLRAYYAAGLGDPDKRDQQITFGSTMSRDERDQGSQVIVDQPYGKTFSDALKAREKIASGLDVTLSQVYLTKDKSSNRRHLLWVADVDPLSIPAGRTPLLDCKPRDIWRPAPLGLDERGRRVLVDLVFWSILIGAQPRKGKTFSTRLLALFAALDPYVRLSVFDGKGSPDWRMFALVAHTFGFGLLPTRLQGDPIENLLATLRAAKKVVMERNVMLSDLPSSVCPEGKLTRDIARNPKYGMPVWMIVLDEIQEYLTTGDNDASLEIAGLLAFLAKVGPSVGLIVLSSTQRPSGIGATEKIRQLFTDYRDNHLARFALKTSSYKVSELILGAGSYSEGYDSSTLPVGDQYRGVGILYDSSVDNCTVRSYLADGEDAQKILTAARAYRERAGTLDGMAAGETVAAQARDPLADALDAFHPDETWLSWTALAQRLAEQLPERYAQVTPDALSNTLRSLKLGIESRSGRDDSTPSGVARGPHRAALERAMERRSRDEAAR